MQPRTVKKELGDLPQADLREFNSSVKYLQIPNKLLLNRWLIFRFLKPYLKNSEAIKILDVGTGVADIPIYLSERLAALRVNAFITGLDSSAQTVNLARLAAQSHPNIRIINARLEEIPDSYDAIIASQIFHHFSPSEAVAFLKTAFEKSTKVVIISDLIRSRFLYWLVKIFTYLTTTNRISRNDGGLSVLRCYDNSEIIKFLESAHITTYKIHNILFRKFVVITHENSH